MESGQQQRRQYSGGNTICPAITHREQSRAEQRCHGCAWRPMTPHGRPRLPWQIEYCRRRRRQGGEARTCTGPCVQRSGLHAPLPMRCCAGRACGAAARVGGQGPEASGGQQRSMTAQPLCDAPGSRPAALLSQHIRLAGAAAACVCRLCGSAAQRRQSPIAWLTHPRNNLMTTM